MTPGIPSRDTVPEYRPNLPSRDTVPGYPILNRPGILSRCNPGKRVRNFWRPANPSFFGCHPTISCTNKLAAMERDYWNRHFKGWGFLSIRIRNKARGATATVLEKIESGHFIRLGDHTPKINKEVAELIFKAMVKEAVERQRHYNFEIHDLAYLQPIKNCVSFVLSSNLDDDGINKMDVQNIMKTAPGFFSLPSIISLLFIASFLLLADAFKPTSSSSSSQPPPEKASKRKRNDAQGTSSFPSIRFAV